MIELYFNFLNIFGIKYLIRSSSSNWQQTMRNWYTINFFKHPTYFTCDIGKTIVKALMKILFPRNYWEKKRGERGSAFFSKFNILGCIFIWFSRSWIISGAIRWKCCRLRTSARRLRGAKRGDQLNMSEGCYSRPQCSHQRSRDPSKFHVRKIIACGDPK